MIKQSQIWTSWWVNRSTVPATIGGKDGRNPHVNFAGLKSTKNDPKHTPERAKTECCVVNVEPLSERILECDVAVFTPLFNSSY